MYSILFIMCRRNKLRLCIIKTHKIERNSILYSKLSRTHSLWRWVMILFILLRSENQAAFTWGSVVLSPKHQDQKVAVDKADTGNTSG